MPELIDKESALARLRGNEAIFKKLLKSFCDKTYLDQLRSELDSGDLAAAAMTAHTVKGVTANLSLTALNENCTKLEAEIKAGTIAPETFATYAQVLEQTLKAIDQYCG